MKTKLPLIALICVSSFISGCAINGDQLVAKDAVCFLAATAAGTGVAAAINSDVEVLAGGMLVGGLIGYHFCGDEKVAAAPAAVADSDGDGVPDNADRCPGTPRGTRVDAAGCPLDSDGEGVTDDKDQCPNTPRGTPVNAVGCPLDSDGDGVADGADKCPDTPRGQAVDARGCHIVFSLEGVNFAYDSSTLTPAANAKLNEAVEMLKANMSMRVRIEGHTDSRGSDEYNMSLSQRRAESVVNYLTSNGIASNRLSSVGRGESAPVATNDTDAGRAQNRRVDFVIQ